MSKELTVSKDLIITNTFGITSAELFMVVLGAVNTAGGRGSGFCGSGGGFTIRGGIIIGVFWLYAVSTLEGNKSIS